MDGSPTEGWEDGLERWLEPFLGRLRRQAQRHWAPVYLKGLILPGERKSVEPMAARVAPDDVQQLHHFVAASPWDTAPLEDELVQAADQLVGGPDAMLVVDDTCLVKQGRHSVGVKRQYCGQLGKRANRQAPSAGLGRPPCGTDDRLRRSWSRSPSRGPRCRSASACACSCPRTGAPIPPDARRQACRKRSLTGRSGRSRWRRSTACWPRAPCTAPRCTGCVLADAEYGKAAEFRAGLAERRLSFALGILPTQKVYPADVTLSHPARKPTGRPRKHPVPSPASVSAAELIAARPEAFRTISWRTGTMIGAADHPFPKGCGPRGPQGGPLKAAFAASRVRVADGPVAARAQHLPGEARQRRCRGLVGERRASGERKYHLSNLPPETPLEVLAASIKARPRPAAAGRACGNGSSALRSMGL